MLDEYGKAVPSEGVLGTIGYCDVPGLPELAITREGGVYDKVRGVPMSVRYRTAEGEEYQYPYVGGRCALHTALARAFIKVPEKYLSLAADEVIINHIDGDKHNHHLDNLEWCTYSDNSLHAYVTGLRSDNTPVSVKQLHTGEIYHFYSMQECARFFEINGAYIFNWIRSKKPISTLKGHYLFIYSGDEWPEYDEEDIGGLRNGQARSVVARPIGETNGPVYIFGSAGEAAKFFGIKSGTLRAQMNRYGDKPYLGYSFCYQSDLIAEAEEEAINIDWKRDWKRTPRKPKRVLITNLETGEEKLYRNTDEACIAWNLSKIRFRTVFSAAANRTYKNHKLEYLDSCPSEE
jgi:hypothetical protein